MLKLFGGGGGGNGEGKTWQGKSFRIEHYHVTVEDVLAEGISYTHVHSTTDQYPSVFVYGSCIHFRLS